MLWGQTLRSQVPYSASIQLCLYVCQSSLYHIFLFSWRVCLYFVPALHHIWFEQYTTLGRMDAILRVFFATLSVRKSLPYPLDITESHTE